jgi:hypothetical protein
MAEKKAEPFRCLWCKNENVGRTNAIKRGYAYLMKVWTEFTKKNLAFLEDRLSTGNIGGFIPLAECSTSARHVFQSDIGCIRGNFIRSDSSTRVRSDIAKSAYLPSMWNRTEFRVLERVGEKGSGSGIEAVGPATIEFGADGVEIDEPAFEQGPRRLL